MLRDRKVRRERTALSRTWRSGGVGLAGCAGGRCRGWWRGGGGAVPLWTSCLINGLLGAADCAIFAEVVCEESGMREDDGETIDR